MHARTGFTTPNLAEADINLGAVGDRASGRRARRPHQVGPIGIATVVTAQRRARASQRRGPRRRSRCDPARARRRADPRRGKRSVRLPRTVHHGRWARPSPPTYSPSARPTRTKWMIVTVSGARTGARQTHLAEDRAGERHTLTRPWGGADRREQLPRDVIPPAASPGMSSGSGLGHLLVELDVRDDGLVGIRLPRRHARTPWRVWCRTGTTDHRAIGQRSRWCAEIHSASRARVLPCRPGSDPTRCPGCRRTPWRRGSPAQLPSGLVVDRRADVGAQILRRHQLPGPALDELAGQRIGHVRGPEPLGPARSRRGRCGRHQRRSSPTRRAGWAAPQPVEQS